MPVRKNKATAKVARKARFKKKASKKVEAPVKPVRDSQGRLNVARDSNGYPIDPSEGKDKFGRDDVRRDASGYPLE